MVYTYTLDPKTTTFQRHTLSTNGTAGSGTQFLALDLDKYGDTDLVSAGKLGVHVFENLRVNHVAKETREQQISIEKRWPFEGEGHIVEQENNPQDLIKNNNENLQ